MWRQQWNLFQKRKSKNVSNSGSIGELRALLFKGNFIATLRTVGYNETFWSMDKLAKKLTFSPFVNFVLSLYIEGNFLLLLITASADVF
jgi:hypothetical protein